MPRHQSLCLVFWLLLSILLFEYTRINLVTTQLIRSLGSLLSSNEMKSVYICLCSVKTLPKRT